MHLPAFGNCVDRAVEEVLVGVLNLKMFGSGTKRWFVKKPKRQQQQRSGRRPCTRKKKRWAAKILKQHRQKILSELDVGAVLPHLVYDKVFSLGEYKEILGQESNKKRTEIFLDHLSSKGPAAFCSFCSVLEEVCPHLLTCFLLDGEDNVPGRAKKGGLPVPRSSPGELPLCSPPMYTNPIFDSSGGQYHGELPEIHNCYAAGSGGDRLQQRTLSSTQEAFLDTPQPNRWLHHSSLLIEHQSGQAITPPHQGPHSQEQEPGQH
ncbi:hypothetical protein Q5P01_012613 [Channa striata]|uniref:CARD domain-containing protein n=1 Tax=Channa striata TaxID=64152 RepID=A0AA88MU32_CHASR|nr:hypothetical protein Q5P01_012613 [Channa striata]